MRRRKDAILRMYDAWSAAAVRVQAVSRGRQARRDVAEYRLHVGAARAVQNCWRGRAARASVQARKDAVLRMYDAWCTAVRAGQVMPTVDLSFQSAP